MASNSAESAQEHPVYKGSCHCGYISYSVRLNLTTPNPTGAILTKCNCTICQKSGALLSIPEEGSFKLLTPTEGESALKDYVFGKNRLHHRFCPTCGIKCFVVGSFVRNGKELHIMRINVNTIDGREDGEEMVELKNIKVKYFAGKDEEWTRGLADEPYEGGTW